MDDKPLIPRECVPEALVCVLPREHRGLCPVCDPPVLERIYPSIQALIDAIEGRPAA